MKVVASTRDLIPEWSGMWMGARAVTRGRREGEKTPVGQLFVPFFGGVNRDYLLLIGHQKFGREAPFVSDFLFL